MRVSIITILLIVVGILISRSISSRLTKTRVIVKSVSFDTQIEETITVGGKELPLPLPGKGIYAVAIYRKFSRVSVRSYHVGVLTVSTFEDQFRDMDTFIEGSKRASTIVLFSVGTTHTKPLLETLRNGILNGGYIETADILRKYGMKKFLTVGHGCRSPYILVRDVASNSVVSERTGLCGGVLCANIVT